MKIFRSILKCNRTGALERLSVPVIHFTAIIFCSVAFISCAVSLISQSEDGSLLLKDTHDYSVYDVVRLKQEWGSGFYVFVK